MKFTVYFPQASGPVPVRPLNVPMLKVQSHQYRFGWYR